MTATARHPNPEPDNDWLAPIIPLRPTTPQPEAATYPHRKPRNGHVADCPYWAKPNPNCHVCAGDRKGAE